MMKTQKLILSALVFMLALFISTVTYSNPVIKDYAIAVLPDPNKKEIDAAKLPVAVKEAIKEGDYADWKIIVAYELSYESASKKVAYEVHFQNSKMEKKSRQYTKGGKVIED